MRLDLYFVERLKEKLEQRSIRCVLEVDKDLGSTYLTCERRLPLEDYYRIIQDLTAELGGTFYDLDLCSEKQECLFLAEFREDTLYIETTVGKEEVKFDIYPEKMLLEKGGVEDLAK